MDITLERIMSLLPKKDDGSFVRGAKKDFALSIGYDSGDIVSMWVKGSSSSYYGKLHEIAAKYNVSVEWLKGETDDPSTKKDTTVTGDVNTFNNEFYDLLSKLTDAEKSILLAQLRGIVQNR